MFPSLLQFAAGLASIHSFTFVAASPEPTITAAPSIRVRDSDAPAPPPLSDIKYPYSALPPQAYPYAVGRGPQYGYNLCNSTTEGPNSLCQTLIVNDISDFCLWGSPDPDSSIGDEEARVVAYCTKPTHGARLISPGAITGVQYMKTSAYIQIVGYISNTAIGLAANDSGGELDPHGADLAGNPLGGLVYSNSTPDAINGAFTQTYNWNMFVGSGVFCVKLCFNNVTTPDFCQNIYDLVGCAYNMPNNAQNNTYTSCEGDLQEVVGVYTVNGTPTTWSMPPTLVAPPPYQPSVPASSNCQTFNATELFGVPTSTSGTARITGTGTVASGGSGAGTGSGATSTSTSARSSALSSIGVPPVFYVLGLGMMAGFALVL